MSSILDKLRVVEALFDPGADTTLRTIAAHALKEGLPDNAIIVGGKIDVIETLTSNAANDAATVAVSVEGADDIVAAIDIADATNVWDAGLRGVLPGNYALDGNALTAIAMAAAQVGSYVKTSQARKVTVTVGTEALDTNAGKMRIYLYYYISE